jgi:hypothetical protein
MDQKFRTSFIPKQEVIRTEPTRAIGFRLSIFSIIAISILAVACILAISVFIYQRSLVKSIEKMNADLVATRDSFDPETIEKYISLDRRIEAGKKILAGHNSLAPVFALLEEQTLRDVRFKNFDYEFDSNGRMNMAMTGEARSFLTIASQSDLWSGEHRIVNPIFNDLNLDDKQIAKFTFKSDLDSQLFLYKNTYMGGSASTSMPEPILDDGDIEITPIEINSSGILPGDNNQ